MNSTTSRTKKAIKNSIFGILAQLSLIIFSFIVRYVFIRKLGDYLLGVNGVYSSLLSLLSISELGFGTALIYTLYKPLAEEKWEEVSAIIHFFKKIYLIIAFVVFLLGICCVPVLQFLINDFAANKSLIISSYFIFLLSIVLSYPLEYKSAILFADQKDYVRKRNSMLVMFVKNILELCFLLIIPNFFIYLSFSALSTIVLNILNYISAKKMYPQVFVKSKKIYKIEKKEILNNVKNLSFYKVFSILITNTDSIYITIFVSTIVVGYYSNYNLVITSISTLVNVLITSISAGVGNYLVSNKKNYERKSLFNFIQIVCFICYGVFSICLLALFDQFQYIYSGENEEAVFSFLTLLSLILNFCLPGLMSPISIFRDASGLFKQTKICALFFCILNIILSLILGYFLGIFGIIFATTISRLCTNFWYEPIVIYKNLFDKKPLKYYFIILIELFLILLIGTAFYFLFKISFFVNMYIDFIAKAFIVFVFSFLILFCIAFISSDFRDRIKYYLSKILHKKY